MKRKWKSCSGQHRIGTTDDGCPLRKAKNSRFYKFVTNADQHLLYVLPNIAL